MAESGRKSSWQRRNDRKREKGKTWIKIKRMERLFLYLCVCVQLCRRACAQSLDSKRQTAADGFA